MSVKSIQLRRQPVYAATKMHCFNRVYEATNFQTHAQANPLVLGETKERFEFIQAYILATNWTREGWA